MNIKNEKGVTLVILVFSIIVLLILGGVSIVSGIDSIRKAKLETLKTNMLLIRVKGKEYCEEANFKIGTDNDLDKGLKYLSEEKQLKSPQTNPSFIDDTYDFIAKLDETELKRIGLNEVANSDDTGDFYIGFKIKNNQTEIYNSKGYKAKNGTNYYKLSDLENIDE